MPDRGEEGPTTHDPIEGADEDRELADEAVQVGRPIDDIVMIRKKVAYNGITA